MENRSRRPRTLLIGVSDLERIDSDISEGYGGAAIEGKKKQQEKKKKKTYSLSLNRDSSL